jgi:aminopeptidase N
VSRIPLSLHEAQRRSSQLRVERVEIVLDLTDPAAETFRSRTTVEFASAGPETFLDFQGRELVAATLNGVPVDVSSWSDGRLALRGLDARNVVVVDGRMAYSSDGEGLHRHVDPVDGETYVYAMSFLDAGPRWFASFDQPDLKARYVLEIAAPPTWTVLGNGPSAPLAPGRWRITPTAPLSTYFVTLVAGPYVSVLDEHAGIRLGLHARASLGAQLRAEADDLLEVTTACLDYFGSTFARAYPFGEYHQAFVPDFNAGAMENPGCVTLRDQMIFRGRATDAERAGRAGVVAHEMAHMWFGDLVTMRWWDDLWLNESCAEYLGHRACTEATRYPLWTEFGIVRKDWGSVADQSPATHPVAGNGAPDSAAALQDFDGISYAKGAAVLKQLAAYVGEEVFTTGLRTYVDRYAFGNASFADLIACWTEAGAVDLDRWAARWLRTTGMDTIDTGGMGTAGMDTAGIDLADPAPVVQVTAQPPGPDQPVRPHALTVGAVAADGAVRHVAEVVLAEEPVAVPVPPGTALVVPDAVDGAWAKIRFGPDGWSDVAAVLPAITDEPLLVVIYNALRDAVRDATLDPEDALDLITRSVPGVAANVIVSALLAFALDPLAAAYSPVGRRADRRLRVHAVTQQIVAESAPGSDRQLTAFRLSVRSSGDAQALRGWLDGSGLPEGIDLDPELRWSVVTQLAAYAGDAAAIAAELAADPSSSAQIHAARARAAIGTPEAKQRAWDLLMAPSAASAYELYATAEGFFVPEQSALTAAYAHRYFDQIAETADFRSGWVLGEVAKRAFPASAVDAETVTLAEELLRTDLAAPVRRAVVDGTDRLRRALRSLAAYST